MSKPAFQPSVAGVGVSANLPGDNRDARQRFLGDVADLSKMLGVFFGEIERAFVLRSGERDGATGNKRFYFSDEWVDRLVFLAGDVHDRGRSLALRVEAMQEEDEFGAEASADAAWQALDAPAADSWEILSDLEGAVAMIEAYRAAISELASTQDNAARRLVGINAVCGPLGDECDVATEAVGKLLDRETARREAVEKRAA